MGLIASMAVVGGVAAIVVTNRDTTVVTNRDTTVETALSLAKEFTADVQALDVQPTTAQPTPPPRPAALPTDAKPTTVEPKGPPASSEIAFAPSKTSTITLRFSVAPPSARIYLDGSRLRSNEIVVPKDDSPHKVHISAPGFVPYDETITFDETQKLAIDLSRSSRAIRATKSVSTSTANRGSDKIESQSPYD